MPAPTIGPLTREVAGILRGRASRFGLKQEQLVGFVGVSQSQVSKLLRGVVPMDLDEFEGFCHALDLEPEDVVREALETIGDELWDSHPDPLIIEGRLERAVGGIAQDGSNVSPLTRKPIEDLSVDELEALPSAATHDATDPHEFGEDGA